MIEVVAPERDVEASDLAASLAAITEGVLAGLPLGASLDAVCHLIERELPGTRSSIRVRDRQQTRGMVPGAAPSLSRAWQAHFDLHDGADLSSLKALWSPGACTWVTDLRTSPTWAFLADAAEREGLRASLCYPVLSGEGSPDALITVYWPETHWPDRANRRVVHLAAVLVAQAVQHHRAERALATASSHDPLTGLPNRTLFADRLRQSLARARRHDGGLAVLFLDLDRFKVINDSLGHVAGDRLLVAAAARLMAAVRPGDTVARFGGDEFTVLCEDVQDAATARALGHRLAEELAKPFVIAQRRFFVTASIGVALGGTGSRPQELIRDADVAMYRSKERGRNRVEVFDAGLRIRTVRRLEDEVTLRRLLDGETLPLLYQAVRTLSRPTYTIGCEARLDWRRGENPDAEPMLGMEPIGLLTIAEESGLIHALGARLLDTACAQVRRMTDVGVIGPLFHLGVFATASELATGGYADVVADALDAHGIHPSQLAVEITEASLADDSGDTATTLHRLHDLGCEVWIEDFGAGATSIPRLRQLPVTGLKITSSLLSGLSFNPQGLALLTGITQLARTLGLRVLAAGVSHDEELQLLRASGVDAVIGPAISPPVAAGDLGAAIAG